jgi:uncharacterized protein Yka (UPF0111/DUF47 family)
MPAKTTVLGALDEHALLLPDLLDRALGANERAKYYLSLLQMAAMRADAPDVAFPDLSGERVSAGVDDPRFDAVVAGARRALGDRLRVPLAAEIVERSVGAVREMMEPLRAASRAEAFEARLAAVAGAVPEAAGDAITAAEITALTSADRGARDTLHLLVMDLHRAINELAAETSTRDLGGARVHDLLPEDEELVLAFMRGVNETARLKLDHPGLGTVASRSGARLILQNDIGTTDAHVLVIHVEDRTARVTYTDVHIARVSFFQSMLEGGPEAQPGQPDGAPAGQRFVLTWEDTRSRRVKGLAGGESFFLCAGVHVAADRRALASFLAFLGSRLVFLIDWNRARRQLRSFVRKPACLRLLQEAAAGGYGHRGFVELGGERLVFDAMEAVMRTPFRFGERLCDMIGDDQAAAYLRFVLRLAAHGLLEGRSRSLLREQVHAELGRYFHGGGERVLDLVAAHARITGALASSVSESLRHDIAEERARAAHLAKDREKEADDLVVETRALSQRVSGTAALRRVVEVADDAADNLEEAVFHLGLYPGPGALPPALAHLADLVVRAAQAFLQGALAAKSLYRSADRATVDAFLAAVDQVVALEHDTDDAERHVLADLLAAPEPDARRLFVISHVASDLEEAADSLMHAALALRDHVQSEVMTP